MRTIASILSLVLFPSIERMMLFTGIPATSAPPPAVSEKIFAPGPAKELSKVTPRRGRAETPASVTFPPAIFALEMISLEIRLA